MRGSSRCCFPVSPLALGYAVEQVEKFGEGDGGRFGSADEGVSFCAECGDGEGHGDAVIAAGVDGGSMEGLAAGDVEAVVELFDFSSHGAKVGGDEGDAV